MWAFLLSALIGIPARAAAAGFHSHRILVKPLDESRLGALEQFHNGRQRRVIRTFPGQGHLQVVRLSNLEPVGEAVARYRSSGLVQFAEPDYAVSAAALLPNDPAFQDGTQWWLNNYGQNNGLPDADTDAPEAWDSINSASNVIVAFVDTGVRPTHEDLAENLWVNPLDGTHGFNALTGGHDLSDSNGHGTILAGLIGAVGNNGTGVAGMAWKVQLMACKFLDASGEGFNSDAVACIEFARTNGARVINLSWGGTNYSESVSNAIWCARADGIIVVAAAGNDARSTDVTPFYPASIELDNVISVGASTRRDIVWSASSYGASSVDLFAPGVSMYSTSRGSDSAYASSDGSSWSAACVSGALALLCEQHPSAPYGELIGRLLAAVDRRDAFSGKCVSGGRLNLRKALDHPSLTARPESWPPQLRVAGIPGHSYTVESTADLAAWAELQTNVTDDEGVWNLTDTDATNAPQRFYRAIPGP